MFHILLFILPISSSLKSNLFVNINCLKSHRCLRILSFFIIDSRFILSFQEGVPEKDSYSRFDFFTKIMMLILLIHQLATMKMMKPQQKDFFHPFYLFWWITWKILQISLLTITKSYLLPLIFKLILEMKEYRRILTNKNKFYLIKFI